MLTTGSRSAGWGAPLSTVDTFARAAWGLCRQGAATTPLTVTNALQPLSGCILMEAGLMSAWMSAWIPGAYECVAPPESARRRPEAATKASSTRGTLRETKTGRWSEQSNLSPTGHATTVSSSPGDTATRSINEARRLPSVVGENVCCGGRAAGGKGGSAPPSAPPASPWTAWSPLSRTRRAAADRPKAE